MGDTVHRARREGESETSTSNYGRSGIEENRIEVSLEMLQSLSWSSLVACNNAARGI